MQILFILQLFLQAIAIGAGILAGVSISLGKQLLFYTLLFLTIIAGSLDRYISSREIFFTKKELYGCLKTAYSIAGFSKEADVRITLYIPCKGKREILKQATRYILSNKYGKYGSLRRGISTSKGVVGECYRTNKLVVSEVKPYHTVKKYLREHYSFDEKEMMKMQLDRRSYFASPVRNESGDVKAVVYLDSSKNNIFTSGVTTIIAKACIAIASAI